MFNAVKTFVSFMINGPKPQKETNMARIVPISANQHGLYNDGQLVGTYARARDAKRGAARRGLTLA